MSLKVYGNVSVIRNFTIFFLFVMTFILVLSSFIGTSIFSFFAFIIIESNKCFTSFL